LDVANVDCAPRLLSSACRNACSEADEPLPDASLEVEPLRLLLALEAIVVEAGVPAVDPAVADAAPVEALVPLAEPLAAVDAEPVAALDVDAEVLEPVNALTNA
jgi:hypothetical protein